MKITKVKVVRIYTLEGAEIVPLILNYLQNDLKISGLSVFRAISGFGETGSHTYSLLQLSFSLPLVIEFFDIPEKIDQALSHFATIIKDEHLISFSANSYTN